jgi:quercetin dioxygenase-like cupin family protein
MASMIKKSFAAPEETRSVDNGKMEFVDLGDATVMRVTFEPGWRWSESVRPIAGTDSCQVAHLIYVVSGRMVVKMDDGAESEIGPGDVSLIPPGHDAWIVGDEPFVGVDFQGGGVYAKPAA